MIVALAGRRVDADAAQTPSFPLANVGRVRQELHDLLVKLKPLALVSSAACGADLLALDEAGALAIRRRVVLPFDADRFLETSVIDRPGAWQSIFERVIEEVTLASDLLVIGEDVDGDESYLLVNSMILDQARDLAKYYDRPVKAVLVWDGQARDAGDLTEAFRLEAERRGCQVVQIRTD